MISLSKSVKAWLERIDREMTRDVMAGRAYYSTVKRGKRTYKGKDTTRECRRSFRRLKKGLLDGTSKVLECEPGKEYEAKAMLMNWVYQHYDPFDSKAIARIKGDVIASRKLKNRLGDYLQDAGAHDEAETLLDFINGAINSSWGQDDADYFVKEFRLIESKEEFAKCLQEKDVEDLTTGQTYWFTPNGNRKKSYKKPFEFISVAWKPVSAKTIYKEMGIYEEFETVRDSYVCNRNVDFVRVLEAFDLWHGVRERAIYYIYAPKLTNN